MLSVSQNLLTFRFSCLIKFWLPVIGHLVRQCKMFQMLLPVRYSFTRFSNNFRTMFFPYCLIILRMYGSFVAVFIIFRVNDRAIQEITLSNNCVNPGRKRTRPSAFHGFQFWRSRRSKPGAISWTKSPNFSGLLHRPHSADILIDPLMSADTT